MDVVPSQTACRYTALLFVVRSLFHELHSPRYILHHCKSSTWSAIRTVVLGRVIRKIHEHPFRGHLFRLFRIWDPGEGTREGIRRTITCRAAINSQFSSAIINKRPCQGRAAFSRIKFPRNSFRGTSSVFFILKYGGSITVHAYRDDKRTFESDCFILLSAIRNNVD